MMRNSGRLYCGLHFLLLAEIGLENTVFKELF
jgi:hypothetical protein